MSHAVLGRAMAPRCGLVPTRQRARVGLHLPPVAPIKAAFAAWRAGLSLTSPAYFQPSLVGSANHAKRGGAA